MSQGRIFISYATSCPISAPAADALYTDLARDFAPFQDRHIRVGEKWRSEIDAHLELCDAAVLLISKAALESHWVKKEATILAWRKLRHPKFCLCVVYVDLKPEELNGTMLDVAGVPEIQAHRSEAHAGDAATIVASVRADFEAARVRRESVTPLQLLLASLTTELTKIDTDARRAAVEALRPDIDQLGWPPDAEAQARLLALSLVEADIASLEAGLNVLLNVIDPVVMNKIVRLTTRFWVDAAAAYKLREVGRRPAGSVALNTANTWTVQQYLARASMTEPAWEALDLTVPVGEQDEVAQRTAFAVEVERLFGINIAAAPQQFEYNFRNQPLFVCVKSAPYVVQTVAKLHGLARAFVMTEGVRSVPDGAEMLEPPLDMDRETSANLSYNFIRFRLKQLERQRDT